MVVIMSIFVEKSAKVGFNQDQDKEKSLFANSLSARCNEKHRSFEPAIDIVGLPDAARRRALSDDIRWYDVGGL